MSDSHVKMTINGGIAEIVIWNPPVQALSAAVRTGLWKQLDRAADDKQAAAVLIRADGRTFPAGADIREFGKPPSGPALPDLCAKVENCPKPVVAALHGTVFGGGLELALSAHFRIAAADAVLGFPEIRLGILPGAGGTQRAPRIAGAAPSIKMMLSGAPVSADEARAMGLVDQIADGDPAQKARAFAHRLQTDGQVIIRRTCDRTDGTADSHRFLSECSDAEAKLEEEINCLPAARRIVQCVRKAGESPFDEGIRFERQSFLRCLEEPESKAMRHMFFAERAAAKMPTAESVKPKAIRSLAVIGGGTMGSGISISCLNAGLEVRLIEAGERQLAEANGRIRAVFDRWAARGRMSRTDGDSRLAGLRGFTAATGALGADLVIEAVPEALDLKCRILANIAEACGSEAVIATNTSYLDVHRLAEACGRKSRFLGLHFFAPAHVMRLLEVVPTRWTALETEAVGFALAKRLGKVAVRAGAQEGFIGNRMLTVYREAADLMLLDGASPFQIDAAMRDFGFAMGIYEVQDLSGLDISWARRKRLAAGRDPSRRYCSLGDRLCAMGWFGQKSGRGYYVHEEKGRRENPAVDALLEDARAECGAIERHSFTASDIQFQILTAMICEGARILEDGGARRPSDIDVIKVCGFGFPRWVGGPMHYADTAGLNRIADLAARLQGRDPEFWSVPDLLRELAREGGSFESMNLGRYPLRADPVGEAADP